MVLAAELIQRTNVTAETALFVADLSTKTGEIR